MDKKIENISQKLATFLKEKRKELDLTQEKLAEIAGIEYKHVQNLESFNRANNPRLSTFLKLSKAMDISVAEIIKSIFD